MNFNIKKSSDNQKTQDEPILFSEKDGIATVTTSGIKFNRKLDKENQLTDFSTNTCCGSVLLYDHEYRELKHTENFNWNTPKPNLHEFNLLVKPNNATI
ncbi:hypothetical protein KUTeg_011794 [Tegillarca granosa]|uniref:Uncharacterized protein n=1 Tax=Tegillarca granosa TaxID=220873 RepID=A0ABQ9EXY1_TEGGR|nr:hypothetical protein KUTeg_011794 [Tegillarca granosa]